MGRTPGKGRWNGGRKKDSPNKKGHFETALPPIRCHDALKAFYTEQARLSNQDLSVYLRLLLIGLMEEVKRLPL
jgi:hypothetical protein